MVLTSPIAQVEDLKNFFDLVTTFPVEVLTGSRPETVDFWRIIETLFSVMIEVVVKLESWLLSLWLSIFGKERGYECFNI